MMPTAAHISSDQLTYLRDGLRRIFALQRDQLDLLARAPTATVVAALSDPAILVELVGGVAEPAIPVAPAIVPVVEPDIAVAPEIVTEPATKNSHVEFRKLV